MTTQRFGITDIKGLTPAVDPVVADGVFALNGRNYVFDSRGPKTAFGNRLLLPQARSKPAYTQGFLLRLRLGNHGFMIDGDGVWEWREDLGGYLLIYATPDTTLSPYRWTHGYLNGYIYFAHPRVGILVYNIDTGICVPHNQIGIATPEDVLAICINNGRLGVLGTRLLNWSAPSNGLDFTPSIGGAGFQLVSNSVPGNPTMISSYAGGIFTWTTGGVMRSEYTGDDAVYRHRAFATNYRPVNSFCTAQLEDDTIVILDERGLFQSKGESPTAFTPLFNEFLIEYVKANKLDVGQNLRIEWDDSSKRLYVSVSLSYANPLFETCFVLYPALDKWGQFNESHYGIIPILIDGSERGDEYYGFVDSDARVRYWLNTGSRQKSVADSESYLAANLFYPSMQRVTYYADSDSGIVLTATRKANTFNRDSYNGLADYYDPINATEMPVELTGLDSKIQFGLIRPTGSTAADELSEIVGVTIRSVESGDESQVSVDFNLTPPATSDEDYNLVVGSDDYGLDNLNYVNHKFKLIGTIDGSTEFMSCVPELVGFVKGARYFSCSNVGVWHIAEISAEDVGEAFHIRSFEFTATSAGRLL